MTVVLQNETSLELGEIYKIHLKECEFRFDNRAEDLYKLFLKILYNQLLNWSRPKKVKRL